MDSDTPALRLEITVPHIPGLPSEESVHSSEATSPTLAGKTHIRLSSFNQRGQPHIDVQEAVTRVLHQTPFQVFEVQKLQAQSGQSWLLEVLRQVESTNRPSEKTGQREIAGTALAFSLTFQQEKTVPTEPAQSYTSSHPPLLPGLQQVIIHLDEEGVPSGYSINGVES